MLEEVEPRPRRDGWRLVAVLAAMVAVVTAGLSVGGEWANTAWSAWEVLPFCVLAVFAYLGVDRWWARALSLLVLAAITAAVGLVTLLLTFWVVLESGPGATSEPESSQFVSALIKLVLASGGIGGAVLIAASGFIPRVRQALARFLPLDPHSFVHLVALVTVVALTLIGFVPLLVLSDPPILSLAAILLAQGEDLSDGRGAPGMLLDELYGLVWLVPAAFVAVGFGLRRDTRETLERLGLRRPTWRQVAVGLAAAVTLVIAVGVVSPGVDQLWGALGWRKTEIKTFEQLLAHFFSPLGAVVIGVVAGLGEELAVRGVLQPRLGIWLSNLFFTGLHALQYNWDCLVIVFAVGLVCGVTRQRTNTTTSAVVHGTYDFLLVMAVVLEIPWFSP